MASSSSQRGAARRAPPPPDQFAAFYKLVDKKVIASQLCRHARDAELSAQAAVQAEALFGDDSLVVAWLRLGESESLVGLSLVASGAEEEVVLLQKSCAVLLSILPLVLRRLEANTLLPGTIREEELEYHIHVQTALRKARNVLVPSLAVLRAGASAMGCSTLILAMYRSLNALTCGLWSPAQKRMVESFVLQGLDFIP